MYLEVLPGGNVRQVHVPAMSPGNPVIRMCAYFLIDAWQASMLMVSGLINLTRMRRTMGCWGRLYTVDGGETESGAEAAETN